MSIHPAGWRQAMTEIGVSPWQHLFERLVGELNQPTSPDWEVQTNRLDPKVYYDVRRFEVEHEQLFRRLPLCLGHVDQLAEPGAVLAVDLCGTPLLMARGADRVLRVFLNVCRHRGARLREKCACDGTSFAPTMPGPIALMDRLPACPAPKPFPISIAICLD